LSTFTHPHVSKDLCDFTDFLSSVEYTKKKYFEMCYFANLMNGIKITKTRTEIKKK